eukprot:TRINITY_DN445_c1_g1_i10.p1 TRINITY_DN445_c1_g1~~TRINITY_DN445_c1_g1_i10.p1  ORF type:complete len:281 (+),score=65.32 TRINITY_DN445_c1_g1_i10:793-1635(+)
MMQSMAPQGQGMSVSNPLPERQLFPSNYLQQQSTLGGLISQTGQPQRIPNSASSLNKLMQSIARVPRPASSSLRSPTNQTNGSNRTQYRFRPGTSPESSLNQSSISSTQNQNNHLRQPPQQIPISPSFSFKNRAIHNPNASALNLPDGNISSNNSTFNGVQMDSNTNYTVGGSDTETIGTKLTFDTPFPDDVSLSDLDSMLDEDRDDASTVNDIPRPMSVPKLDIAAAEAVQQNQQNFNDEFLSNKDKFSKSWRSMAEDQESRFNKILGEGSIVGEEDMK